MFSRASLVSDLQYASKKSYHTVEINRRLDGTTVPKQTVERRGSNAHNVRVSGDRLNAHAHARAHARAYALSVRNK